MVKVINKISDSFQDNIHIYVNLIAKNKENHLLRQKYVEKQIYKAATFLKEKEFSELKYVRLLPIFTSDGGGKTKSFKYEQGESIRSFKVFA